MDSQGERLLRTAGQQEQSAVLAQFLCPGGAPQWLAVELWGEPPPLHL